MSTTYTVDCGELVPKAAQKLLDHGLRGRPDPAPRFSRVCTVKPNDSISRCSSASLAFSQARTRNSGPARLAIWPSRARWRFRNSRPIVTDTDLSVRIEAVKSLDDIGGPKTVDALVQAAQRYRSRDPDPRHRRLGQRLSAGLSQKPASAALCSASGTPIKAKFSDTNDQIIDAYVEVRPEVIEALGTLATAGASLRAAPTPAAPSAFCAAAPRFRI